MMRKVIVKLTEHQPWVCLEKFEGQARQAELHDEGTQDEFIAIADENGFDRYVYLNGGEDDVSYFILDEQALLERLRQAIQDCETIGEVVHVSGCTIEGATYNPETNVFEVE
ncbi:hypothetical protein [Vibrio phage VCPH]|nr:hypothetical protein [Vibrio phage VCPH]